ncbi:hypothetical protein JJB11_13025 [Ramlibacter ginsenosidimutans]|uniref:Uncharacterized protein n=1 Tax=Ramlibacter ginsenosidimutans TaxID=502333 RepID=A0A934TT12_9BURK|nr:hypothetical protein [Ramlibacter ginsenosidimutans]MBK6007017.1 hypothetical protein [Ramlibacter ginsenosidimutans]
MPAADRLLAAFLLLTAAFLALVGFAAFELVVAGQHGPAAVVALAGLGGAAAGAFTYWLLQRDAVTLAWEGEALAFEIPMADEPAAAVQPHLATAIAESQPTTASATLRRASTSVQHMPVADLPAAYVDAVLRGAEARLRALDAQRERH